jgi:hypothetical protein
MTKRFIASLSFSLLSVAALAGCPSSNDHDARFADATDQQLQRSLSSASGTDLVMGLFIGSILSGGNSEPGVCPSIVTSGDTTTVTGGCTTEDGDVWDGTIVVVANEAELSVDYDLHIAVAVGDDEVDLRGSIVADNEAQTIVGDFTIDAEGIYSTSRVSLGCETDGPCTASPDSEIEIENLGGAGVSGSWSLGDVPSGSVTLEGADKIVFDMSTRDANGCVSFTLGDETGTVCDPNSGSEDAFATNVTWSSRILRARF